MQGPSLHLLAIILVCSFEYLFFSFFVRALRRVVSLFFLSFLVAEAAVRRSPDGAASPRFLSRDLCPGKTYSPKSEQLSLDRSGGPIQSWLYVALERDDVWGER